MALVPQGMANGQGAVLNQNNILPVAIPVGGAIADFPQSTAITMLVPINQPGGGEPAQVRTYGCQLNFLVTISNYNPAAIPSDILVSMTTTGQNYNPATDFSVAIPLTPMTGPNQKQISGYGQFNLLPGTGKTLYLSISREAGDTSTYTLGGGVSDLQLIIG